MTLQEVTAYFDKNYPNARIIEIPEGNPLEIICEIDPSEQHPNYSVALAAISASKRHKHATATEAYEVISGTLLMEVDGSFNTLYEREKITVRPGQVHAATSTVDYALVKVTSQPGWTEADHILV